VLIGNPLIVVAIMGWMGYRNRTGFLAGLTVAQISEFSLIFTAMGVSLGHLNEEILGLITLVGLITIAASTYMITYSHALYGLMEPALKPFERRPDVLRAEEHESARDGTHDAVVLGLGRYGYAIAQALRERGFNVLGVDFNPMAVRAARERGLDVLFGDATDPEFLASLPMNGVRWAVAALPEHATGLMYNDPRRAFIQSLRTQGFRGRIGIAAHADTSGETLRAAGADMVVSTRAIERYATGLRAASLLTIDGARHELLQEADIYREQLLAAFAAFVPGTDTAIA
jgi:hypothetical protein